MNDFADKAQRYWTEEREKKLLGGKKLLLMPSEGASLLRALGLLNSDASMSADSVRKFTQVNHMLALLAPQIEDLAKRHPTVRVFDACCGNSYLAFLVAWYVKEKLAKNCEIIGIDRNPKVIEKSVERAKLLGLDESMKFLAAEVDAGAWERAYAASFPPPPEGEPIPRPHMTLALHACDMATDHALGAAIAMKSDVIAVAPCCHAELAQHWKEISTKEHPLAPVFRTPNLRRETAAHMTDTLRFLLLRSRGYEVTATEFVPSDHTPKNRLLLAERRGRFLESAATEFGAMKAALGEPSLALERLLGAMPT